MDNLSFIKKFGIVKISKQFLLTAITGLFFIFSLTIVFFILFNKKIFITGFIFLFLSNILYLFYIVKFLIQKITFEYFPINNTTPHEALHILQDKMKLNIVKVSEDIYYFQYLQNRRIDKAVKEVIFIINDSEIALNIHYKDDTIMLSLSDPIEKEIRNILSLFSTTGIIN